MNSALLKCHTLAVFYKEKKKSVLWWYLCRGRPQSAKCLQIFKLGMLAHFFEVLGVAAYLKAEGGAL